MTRSLTRSVLAPAATLAALALGLSASPAQAGLMLSKVILDLGPDGPPRDDVELWNDGAERLYVVAEPSEIVDPGRPTEQRRPSPDPAVTGLLVSPQKLVLEPGEHKLVRIAAVAARPARDRIYRVTIKPVAGPVSSEQSALKLYVGYDVLVILRPDKPGTDLVGTRAGNQLTIHNHGNSSVELAQGKQCDESGANCRDLPATRLYAGADWTVAAPLKDRVSYRVYSGGAQKDMAF